MRKCVCFVLMLWLSATSFAAGQHTKHSWTFAAFNSDLTRLTFRFPPSSPEEVSVAASLKSLQAIRASFVDAYGVDADTEENIVAKLPALYSETMLEDIHAVETLPSDHAARLAVLEAVRDDLQDKEKLRGASPGILHTFPATVTVTLTVVILAPSHVVPALVNLHVNSCLRGTSDPGYTFGNDQKGIDVVRSPGCICVWAETAGQIVTLPPLTRDIGPSGQHVSITVPVQK